MAERVKSREWPLVVFTLALQLSCGLVLAVTLSEVESGPPAASPMQPIGFAAFSIVLLGMLASVLHLGRPWSAWRSLRNLRQSRLSLEVLLTGLYAASCAAYGWSWFTGHTDVRPVLGVMTSVLGLAAVVSSAMIYMLPSQPAWNFKWVLGSFLGTTFTLGGAAVMSFTTLEGKPGFASAPVLTLAGALLVIVSAGQMWRCARAHSRSGRVAAAPYVFTAANVVLGGVLPVAMAAQIWLVPAALGVAPEAVLFTMLAGVVAGAFSGRMLLYSLMSEAF